MLIGILFIAVLNVCFQGSLALWKSVSLFIKLKQSEVKHCGPKQSKSSYMQMLCNGPTHLYLQGKHYVPVGLPFLFHTVSNASECVAVNGVELCFCSSETC